MMYYDVELIKCLEIPKWVTDRDTWGPYIIFIELKLPFAPFAGLNITDDRIGKEEITEVRYNISDNVIEAMIWDFTAEAKLIEGVSNDVVQEFMDELYDDHKKIGWKDYDDS